MGAGKFGGSPLTLLRLGLRLFTRNSLTHDCLLTNSPARLPAHPTPAPSCPAGLGAPSWGAAAAAGRDLCGQGGSLPGLQHLPLLRRKCTRGGPSCFVLRSCVEGRGGGAQRRRAHPAATWQLTSAPSQLLSAAGLGWPYGWPAHAQAPLINGPHVAEAVRAQTFPQQRAQTDEFSRREGAGAGSSCAGLFEAQQPLPHSTSALCPLSLRLRPPPCPLTPQGAPRPPRRMHELLAAAEGLTLSPGQVLSALLLLMREQFGAPPPVSRCQCPRCAPGGGGGRGRGRGGAARPQAGGGRAARRAPRAR
jgi:hypothetical protein